MTIISDTNRITIGLLPYELDANAYIAKNRKILDRIGTVLPVPRPKPLLIKALKHFLKTGRFKLYDVLIVNWRENSLRNGDNNLHLAGVIEYFFSLLLHRTVAGKLIYVRHNSHPHNLPSKSIRPALQLVKVGQLLANNIVIHSPQQGSEQEKTIYVPHPLYDVMPQASPNSSQEASENSFIMIGRVQRYKKIDEVISHWNGLAKLVILGPSSDIKYLNQLKELAKNKNVEFEIDFHAERYLAKRAANSKGVIITNDNNSMLVSGSYFFAISCGAVVYATRSPFFEWAKTTSLAPYLVVADTLSQLTATAVADADSCNARDKHALRAEAEKFFGDEVVEDAWRKAIGADQVT